MLGRVAPSVFLPRPNVDSALVKVVRRQRPAVDVDPDHLFTLVRAGFGQRRKMLRRSLAGLLNEAAIEALGVDPTDRAEQLGLEQWAALASATTFFPSGESSRSEEHTSELQSLVNIVCRILLV